MPLLLAGLVCTPFASTQAGVTKRFRSTGTASPSTICLSAIEIELSIMNKRSILSTAV
jgi:hypothetical protein